MNSILLQRAAEGDRFGTIGKQIAVICRMYRACCYRSGRQSLC